VSSNRIHCCYIITGTEFKGKHNLEQDEVMFCCFVVQSSTLGLKKKIKCVLFTSLRTPDPSLLLRDSGLIMNLPGIGSLSS